MNIFKGPSTNYCHFPINSPVSTIALGKHWLILKSGNGAILYFSIHKAMIPVHYNRQWDFDKKKMSSQKAGETLSCFEEKCVTKIRYFSQYGSPTDSFGCYLHFEKHKQNNKDKNLKQNICISYMVFKKQIKKDMGQKTFSCNKCNSNLYSKHSSCRSPLQQLISSVFNLQSQKALYEFSPQSILLTSLNNTKT